MTVIRQAKYALGHELAEEVRENSRAFYAYARSHTTLRDDLKTVKKCDGTMMRTVRETCEVRETRFITM